jgi:alkylation response protein AidB-like acyl-CoA dehydrogenase
VTKLQSRLAYHSAPTAVAVNMHIYWTGVAADLARNGDDSCRWILEKAAAGEIFAAIHGEAGNDLPLLLSTATAERVEGGWRVNGHKIFGSLSPVWTYAGFHAMDTSDPAGPRIVHGFVPRDSPGLQIVDTWDTLGMRATQSHDTVLHDVFVPDELCPLVCPAGFAGKRPFQASVFAWALLGFAAVYHGAARRAFDLTVARMPQRSSVALTRSMAYHPEVQHNVAEMRVALDAADALLERTTTDWARGVAHPDWPVRLIGTRYFVINKAFEIVDRAMDLSGGAAAFRRNRLEQIYRDVRMGRFHPGNTLLAHELIGKLCLGVNPDDPQRWG